MQYLRQPKPVNAKLCTLGFMPWAKLAWSLLTKLKQTLRTICVSIFRRLNLFIEFLKARLNVEFHSRS
jgi:hypothetical protein